MLSWAVWFKFLFNKVIAKTCLFNSTTFSKQSTSWKVLEICEMCAPDTAKSAALKAIFCCRLKNLLFSAFEKFLIKIQWIYCCNSSTNDPSKIYRTTLFSACFQPNSWNWNFFQLLLMRGPKWLIGQYWINLASYLFSNSRTCNYRRNRTENHRSDNKTIPTTIHRRVCPLLEQ